MEIPIYTPDFESISGCEFRILSTVDGYSENPPFWNYEPDSELFKEVIANLAVGDNTFHFAIDNDLISNTLFYKYSQLLYLVLTRSKTLANSFDVYLEDDHDLSPTLMQEWLTTMLGKPCTFLHIRSNDIVIGYLQGDGTLTFLSFLS